MRLCTGFVLLGGLGVVLSAPAAWADGTPLSGERGVVINEMRIDQWSIDNDEYFELAGIPGTLRSLKCGFLLFLKSVSLNSLMPL